MTKKRNWKSYCNSPCMTCSANSIFFVKTASRYCYDDKFELPQVPKRVIYKLNGKNHVLATGIIDHETYSHDSDVGGDNGDKCTWEKNLMPTKPENYDTATYAMKEACKELKVSFDRLIGLTQKIKGEGADPPIVRPVKLKGPRLNKKELVYQIPLF